MSGRKKKVRILDPKPARPKSSERLEQRARELTRRNGWRDGKDPITAIVEREVALTLDHLDELRQVHRRIHRSLIRHECYLGTEIIQREPTPPAYEDPRLPERDRLRDRLRKIDEERRRWAAQYAKECQTLLDRLLSLVGRREQLGR